VKAGLELLVISGRSERGEETKRCGDCSAALDLRLNWKLQGKKRDLDGILLMGILCSGGESSIDVCNRDLFLACSLWG